MNKITFPRVGYDGIERSEDDIKKWSEKRGINGEIQKRLGCKITKEIIGSIDETDKEKIIELIDELKIPDKLNAILFYKPKEIEENKAHFAIIKKYDKLKTAIEDAFYYKEFRKRELVELAKMLNVKVCPYCNMQYTLYAEEKDGEETEDELAKFQFDHFISKTDYPMFSMSLYNLIPSCAVCNHGKRDGELPVELNPYYNDIHKLFHFEVKDQLDLLLSKKVDRVDIKTESTKGNEQIVNTYNNIFHISTLYSRHKDIVQEIYDKAYIASSAENLARLLKTDKKRLSELWYGTYLDEKDIEKRPLTKFIQDIKKQSESIF